MDRETWDSLLLLEKEFARRDQGFGRKMIAETLGCSSGMARLYEFALHNRQIIKTEKDRGGASYSGQRVFLFSDVHIPFHDQVALDAALSHADEYRPDTIVILGDLLDFYRCSRFTKKTGGHDMKGELLMGRAFLTDLRARFPTAEIIWLEGNHESHLERYVLENAAEIANLVDDLLINKLNLVELKIDYRRSFFQIGKLYYLHGHEKPGGGTAEYVTNVMFKYVLDHCIFGHVHRSQEKIFKRIDGTTLWVGANGCLCGPLEYAPLNNWNQGFATITYGSNGTFRAKLWKIQDGEIF